MEDVDFGEADLTEAIFDTCNLAQSIFEYSKLAKADFQTAYNYQIDPEINALKKTKFSKEGALGLLSKYDIIVD